MAQAGVERDDRGGPMGEIVTLRDQGLGNASYLVDLGDGRGLVLDPSRDPGPYLDAAARRGLRLAWTAETHLHADFVSGSRELAAHGATVLAPAAARLGFPHRGLGDGDQLDLGGLGLRALATPGHTPEHLAFLLADGARPLALFSGGSLLVGAVARTDLISPDRTQQLARALWRSLHQRVLTLPDDLGVYPTHGAGSFFSAPTGTAPTTTIAREKATNPLLAAPDEDTFVKLLVGGLGSYPRYFLRLRETNRRGPRIWGATPPPVARTPLVGLDGAEGRRVLDVRQDAEFAAGHIPGAAHVELGALTDPADLPAGPLAVICGHGERAMTAASLLQRAGRHDVTVVDGGTSAWADAGRRLEPQR